ncbi:MAG: hypothetical protein HOD60_03785 [Candidatus Nitrosopelagicus sp.]|nr:hypothetical protein [Candidatus Nitrosopelagicus sp.]
MKPVVIIALSVICSVVAVLGVLVAMEMYAINEAKKAVAIELERQKVCDRLYDTTGSAQEIELWGICLNYGIIESVNADAELCGISLSDSAGLCRTDKKLEAIRWIEREITINQDFYQLALSQKSDLQAERNGYKQSIGIEQEKQSRLKADLLNATEDELIEIYNSCDTTSYKYSSVSCINLLNEITNVICDKYGNNDSTCFTKTQMDIKADRDIRVLNPDDKTDKWNEVVYTCQTIEEITFDTNYSEMQQCVCRYFEDGYFGDKLGPWNDHCHELDEFAEAKRIADAEAKRIADAEAIDEQNEKMLSEIKMNYSECKKNEKYENACYEGLRNNIEEYCKTTVGMSYPEYDQCFGEITKIQ